MCVCLCMCLWKEIAKIFSLRRNAGEVKRCKKGGFFFLVDKNPPWENSF